MRLASEMFRCYPLVLPVVPDPGAPGAPPGRAPKPRAPSETLVAAMSPFEPAAPTTVTFWPALSADRVVVFVLLIRVEPEVVIVFVVPSCAVTTIVVPVTETMVPEVRPPPASRVPPISAPTPPLALREVPLTFDACAEEAVACPIRTPPKRPIVNTARSARAGVSHLRRVAAGAVGLLDSGSGMGGVGGDVDSKLFDMAPFIFLLVVTVIKKERGQIARSA